MSGLNGPEIAIVLSFSGCSLEAGLGKLPLFAVLGKLKGEN